MTISKQLSPVGYLNKMTGHIWTPTEQPNAAAEPGLYEPLVLSREALAVVQQKDALQLQVDNILRGLGITGDGPFSQLVLEKFIAIQAERDALAAENAALNDWFSNNAKAVGHWNSWADEEDKIPHSPATPATDAVIANTQAGALDVFANAAEEQLAIGKEKADVVDTGFNLGVEAMISMLRMSANALRAGRKG
ncbi:hypothetical protein [Ewingella americana]|uniref:Uncharacterized protein n=2 Tax=Ewingella americana TaxID=41202 RepID=A0A085G132_EWIA3|nr:hypothetical protein [Ewingella americana]KAA8726715.1 hypothetical protein F4W05_17780 [Ewingella americana]KFC77427.1 hypothetical protein GEAM_4278 [Ewingella americana ATCC 33852]STS10378.1 Uncharacterised protein [Ewingella americana]